MIFFQLFMEVEFWLGKKINYLLKKIIEKLLWQFNIIIDYPRFDKKYSLSNGLNLSKHTQPSNLRIGFPVGTLLKANGWYRLQYKLSYILDLLQC